MAITDGGVNAPEEEASRLAIEAENMGISEVVFTPPGEHNQDPGDAPIHYAVMRMGTQVIGALWASTTGAAGVFPAPGAGEIALNYEAIWADRLTQARIRYGLAEEPWDALSWLDYWLESISGAGNIRFESGLTGYYDDVQRRFTVLSGV